MMSGKKSGRQLKIMGEEKDGVRTSRNLLTTQKVESLSNND